MYIKSPFNESDSQEINKFLKSCSFVTIVSSDNKGK